MKSNRYDGIILIRYIFCSSFIRQEYGNKERSRYLYGNTLKHIIYTQNDVTL